MKSILVDAERCLACKSCEIACALNRSSLSKQLPEAMYETPSPLSRVRVEDAGHNVHHDQPERLAEIIEAFMAR